MALGIRCNLAVFHHVKNPPGCFYLSLMGPDPVDLGQEWLDTAVVGFE